MKIVHLIACIAIAGTFADAQTLQQVIASKMDAITDLGVSARVAHHARCSDVRDGCGSLGCSVPACGNTFSTDRGFACNVSFGSNHGLCGSGNDGLITSVDEGTVRIAPGTDFNSAEAAAFSCASRRVDTRFRQNLGSGRVTAWQYVSSITGTIRTYPGQPQSRNSVCSNYDPRLRPWYVAASSGPKDVILVLDISGSMFLPNSALDPDGQTRMQALQNTVKVLLDTLTHNDFVGIVVYSTDASYVPATQTTLLRATTANINTLKQAVDDLIAFGLTYMDKGFDLAFDMFINTQELSSRCNRVIVFLTDGDATDPPSVMPAVNAGQARLGDQPAIIFTYSMGEATSSLPKDIACAHSGVWARISDGQDPLSQMSQYYQYLAAGIDDQTVRWTTPYEDAWGLGTMVTGAIPFYDRTRSVPVLAGVVGVDILMSEFQRFADFQTVVSQLIASGNTCPSLNLTKCQMQHLRGTAGQCSGPEWADYTLALCNSRNEIYRLPECDPVSGGVNSVMCEPLSASGRVSTSGPRTDQQVMCCNGGGGGSGGEDDDDDDSGGGGAAGAVIGGVVAGVIVVVGVIVGVIVMIRRSAAEKARTRFEGSGRRDPDGPNRSRGHSMRAVSTGPPAPAPADDGPVLGYPVQHRAVGYPPPQQQDLAQYPSAHFVPPVYSGGGGGYPQGPRQVEPLGV